MTEQEIQKIEEKCKIKSKDEFLHACNKAGIKSEWYSFSYDKNKPVCFDGNSVYYGIAGVTNCHVEMTKWDVGYDKLLNYKNEYEWEQLGLQYKVESIKPIYKNIISERNRNLQLEYPYVQVWDFTPTNKPVDSMLTDGWEPGGYDQYMGYFNYYKNVDIRDNIKCIEIFFKKRTNKRDRDTFGFTDAFTYGVYKYPVPNDMIDDVANDCFLSERFPNKDSHEILSSETCLKIAKVYDKRILEDEYSALCRLKDEHLKALESQIDSSLAEREQKSAFAAASREVTSLNPAYGNYLHSRSHIITQENFDKVYKMVGIKEDL